MKIKLFIVFTLSAFLFSCSDELDTQPDRGIENVASMPADNGSNTSVLYNIPTNFVLDGTSTDEAIMSFGISVTQSADVSVKAGFFIKILGQSNFVPIFSPYNNVIIPANQPYSAHVDVNREDFGICESSFILKMQVLEVRVGGTLVPASDYNVLGFNSDGSTQLDMTGPGCGGSGGGGGYLGGEIWDIQHSPVIPGGGL